MVRLKLIVAFDHAFVTYEVTSQKYTSTNLLQNAAKMVHGGKTHILALYKPNFTYFSFTLFSPNLHYLLVAINIVNI